MANADQILTLIRNHYNGDEDGFRKQILQMSISEAQAGHASFARVLRDLAQSSTKKNIFPKFNLQNSELSDVLLLEERKENLSNFVSSQNLNQRIQRIIIEYRQRDKLYSYNLDCRRKILLSGQPGTGKTMTASILANELNLPLFIVRLEKIITKFMGETSIKLAKVFDWISTSAGIYLFDEFDAIGQQRGLENEVGEMRRILNTFLQLMDRDQSQSLILAATNDRDSLDNALFRRFDDILTYTLPDKDEISEIIRIQTAKFPIQDNWGGIEEEFLGLSHAEICMILNDAIKDSVIGGNPLTRNSLLEALANRKFITKVV